jgi:ribosomal protein S18 acetylase RimI-like enzyme
LSNEYTVFEGGAHELYLIQDLWKELRLHVKGHTEHFKDQFDKMPFDDRKTFLLSKSKGGNLHLDLVKDNEKKIIAYCICTITNDKVGEIDSIYIKEEFRLQGIGNLLVKRAIKWMDENRAISKKILVTVGNDEAIRFYKNYGFQPRSLILEFIED